MTSPERTAEPSFHHFALTTPTVAAVAADAVDELRGCMTAQRAAAADAARTAGLTYTADPDPSRHASPEALRRTLAQGADVSDVRTHQDLGNAWVFHTSGLPLSVVVPEVVERRERVDALVPELVRRTCGWTGDLDLVASGHFWYPPGGYLGWHTNSRVPGWRVYLTFAAEPARSGLRYRDLDQGDLHTTWDGEWDLRVFRVGPERPLWHAVWSDTDRFSFGYRLVDPTGR